LNYLQLARAAASECGVSQTGPTDTTSQSGRLLQIVNWINRSWMDIQTKRNDWLFMRSSFTLDTTASDYQYASTDATDTATSSAIANFRDWCKDPTLTIYLVSAGVGTETRLHFLDYRDFCELYLVGSVTNSYPRHWTRAPNGNLWLGPTPDAIYRVSGDFMHSATELSGDSDTPELPNEYHMAIVYRTMMKYGRYIGANEVFTDGQAEYARMLREMIRTQAPAPRLAGPLADA
jgi:hypothetical protein